MGVHLKVGQVYWETAMVLGGERRQMVLHLQLSDQTNEGSLLVPSKTLPDSFQYPGGLL